MTLTPGTTPNTSLSRGAGAGFDTAAKEDAAETKSPDHLPRLFEKQIIQVALASRFVFPAPGPQKPKTAQDWFDKRYQIVVANNISSIPPAE